MAQENRWLEQGGEIVKIYSAEFLRALRAASQPEDMMAIAVFGIGSGDPLATAALETIQKGPLRAAQGYGAFPANRDNHFANRDLGDIIFLIAKGHDKVIRCREIFPKGSGAVV